MTIAVSGFVGNEGVPWGWHPLKARPGAGRRPGFCGLAGPRYRGCLLRRPEACPDIGSILAQSRTGAGPATCAAEPVAGFAGCNEGCAQGVEVQRQNVLELRTLIAFLAIILALMIAWRIVDVLFLAFAAVIAAVLLKSFAELIQRGLPFIAHPWHILLATVILTGGVGTTLFLFGLQAIQDLGNLISRLPQMLDEVGTQFGAPNLGTNVETVVEGVMADGGALGGIAAYMSNMVGAITGVVIVLFTGFFLAIDADRYKSGMLALVPPRHRPKARQVLEKAGRGLQLWLLGQLAAMVVVGLATTAGLMLIGVEQAVPLGILAALLEFIPFIGPIFAYLAALLITLPEGFGLALWVTAIYLAIQQLESNVLVPLIQQKTVELPPALGVLALIALGTMFGPMGLLFGVPLTVVLLIAVKQLYVRDVLKQETTVPGEKRPAEQDDEAHDRVSLEETDASAETR